MKDQSEKTNSKNKCFTFGGKENDLHTTYYKDIPEEVRSKLDESIKKRCVHLYSKFAEAALKGGYDPEKVSYNTLVSKGLLEDLNKFFR